MSAEHNRWIVSSRNFVEHRTPEIAQAEMGRLQKLNPKKQFRVYRIKRTVDYRDEVVTADATSEALETT